MGTKASPQTVLRTAIRLSMRRLRYIDRMFPNPDSPNMKKWNASLSKELQGYIQVLRGANKESQTEIQRLVQKFTGMETDRLRAILEEHAKQEEGKAKDVDEPASTT